MGETNTGLEQATLASQDQPCQFTIPKIEAELKGIVFYDGELQFVPSEAISQSYYSSKNESFIKLTLKLKE